MHTKLKNRSKDVVYLSKDVVYLSEDVVYLSKDVVYLTSLCLRGGASKKKGACVACMPVICVSFARE